MCERELVLKQVGDDDPDAVRLIAEVRQEYVRRHGGQDTTPVAPDEFAPPGGLFVVGYATRIGVPCGGWRARRRSVRFRRRRRGETQVCHAGHARISLAERERTATSVGGTRIVLESGTKQPEGDRALPVCDCAQTERSRTCRDEPGCRCFGTPLP